MKRIVLLIGVLGASVMARSWSESFESPDYHAGQKLGEEGIWQASSPEGGTIISEEAAVGSQSLKISDGATVKTAVHPEGVKFYQFYILPTFQEAAPQPSINVAGAEFSFLKTSESIGGVAIYANPSTPSVLMRSAVALTPSSNTSEAWVLVTVRVDGVKKKWDLFLDGLPVASNQPLSSIQNVLSIYGTGGVIYLDNYTERAENPLFADSDRDGIPDAEEKAFGMNAYGDDRDADLDGDGASNADEFFAGTSPRAPGAMVPRSMIYVDNLNGNDTNVGDRSYVTAAHGPKRSLKAAIATAPPGSAIMVLKGTGLYDEGSQVVAGKDITIIPFDAITLK